MSPKEAARELDAQLRPFQWFLSIGVGKSKVGRESLFVYVKSKNHPELKSLENGWRGYNVLIRPVGAIRPVAGGTHSQLIAS